MSELAHIEPQAVALEPSRLQERLEQLVVVETLVARAYHGVDDLVDEVHRDRLRTFRRDHERCLEQLWLRLSALCGDDWDAGRIQTASRTSTECVAHGVSPLMAMWFNEDETACAYEDLLEDAGLDRRLQRLLQTGLDQAREHWNWLTLHVHPQLS
jgi:hypothetical protein